MYTVTIGSKLCRDAAQPDPARRIVLRSLQMPGAGLSQSVSTTISGKTVRGSGSSPGLYPVGGIIWGANAVASTFQIDGGSTQSWTATVSPNRIGGTFQIDGAAALAFDATVTGGGAILATFTIDGASEMRWAGPTNAKPVDDYEGGDVLPVIPGQEGYGGW